MRSHPYGGKRHFNNMMARHGRHAQCAAAGAWSIEQDATIGGFDDGAVTHHHIISDLKIELSKGAESPC
jgi:hypothetical protein